MGAKERPIANRDYRRTGKGKPGAFSRRYRICKKKLEIDNALSNDSAKSYPDLAWKIPVHPHMRGAAITFIRFDFPKR